MSVPALGLPPFEAPYGPNPNSWLLALEGLTRRNLQPLPLLACKAQLHIVFLFWPRHSILDEQEALQYGVLIQQVENDPQRRPGNWSESCTGTICLKGPCKVDLGLNSLRNCFERNFTVLQAPSDCRLTDQKSARVHVEVSSFAWCRRPPLGTG